jgi:hypothetical protein
MAEASVPRLELFFAGVGRSGLRWRRVKETLEVMKIPTDTVKRDWSLAKVWLFPTLGGGSLDGA